MDGTFSADYTNAVADTVAPARPGQSRSLLERRSHTGALSLQGYGVVPDRQIEEDVIFDFGYALKQFCARAHCESAGFCEGSTMNQRLLLIVVAVALVVGILMFYARENPSTLPAADSPNTSTAPPKTTP